MSLWGFSISLLRETPITTAGDKNSSSDHDGEEKKVLHDFAIKEFVLMCDEGDGGRSSKAFIKYEIVSNKSLHFLTTQVPQSQKGKGIGKILVKEALEFCVENQMKFSSSCWYINDYMTKFVNMLR